MAQRKMVTLDAIKRVREVYTDNLAALDAPARRAASEHTRAFQDGYTAGIRDVMIALLGEREWDRLHTLDTRNYLDLRAQANAVPVGENWCSYL